MPPCDYSLYPKNWKTEIRPAILERDNNCCKFCGVENYSVGYRDKKGVWNNIAPTMQGETDAMDAEMDGFKIIKIVLTIMHLDHDTTNNNYDNLASGCQKCHLNYDKEHHKKNSRATRENKKGLQKLF